MKRRAGFTLVEVIVAVAVTVVLMSLMLQVLNQSSIIWNRSNESLDTFREARSALELMSRELGGVRAMPVSDMNFPLLSLRHHPSTPAEDRRNQEIYAVTQTRHDDKEAKSNLCAVGYYCKWVESRNAYSLMRQYTPPGDTFANLRRVLNIGTPMTGTAAFEQLYARVREEAVATYLWDLRFEFPENLGIVADAGAQQEAWPQGDYSKKLPPWIEVRCKALGSLAARRIKGTSFARDDWYKPEASAYQKLVLPYQQQFVTRISFAQ